MSELGGKNLTGPETIYLNLGGLLFSNPELAGVHRGCCNSFFSSSKKQANTKAPAANTSCALDKTWTQTFPCGLFAALGHTDQPN